MADPVAVPCPVDVYTIVATGVTNGSLMVISNVPNHYLWTYVMTTNAAPANTDYTNAAVMDSQQPFGFIAAVDIYVQPKGGAGSVSRWV